MPAPRPRSSPPWEPTSSLTVYAIALVYGLGRAVAAHPTLPGEILLASLGVLLFLLLRQS